jgi:hypothetical protein
MFQPQAVQIEWYKDNRVYIRTEMLFGTRLNLKPFEAFEVHFPTLLDLLVERHGWNGQDNVGTHPQQTFRKAEILGATYFFPEACGNTSMRCFTPRSPSSWLTTIRLNLKVGLAWQSGTLSTLRRRHEPINGSN